ncbi:MAG: phenylalanine--tRNA ligase subunit beta, partial [Acidobacteria bacterium]|nr:phenylalanine--tRNA ligase subunit beta [Acidobacteriota bacterium]
VGIGERVAWLEIDLLALLQARRGPGQYRPISRYPSSDVDLSFEVDEAIPAGQVERALREAGVAVVVEVRLLDVYRGPAVAGGRRSLTYRLRLQARDRTLTDDEIARARQQLIDAVEASLPASLRS